MIQTIIVILVVAGAFAYASWRAYKALTAENKTCAGCPLKETCKKNTKQKSSRNMRRHSQDCK